MLVWWLDSTFLYFRYSSHAVVHSWNRDPCGSNHRNRDRWRCQGINKWSFRYQKIYVLTIYCKQVFWRESISLVVNSVVNIFKGCRLLWILMITICCFFFRHWLLRRKATQLMNRLFYWPVNPWTVACWLTYVRIKTH